MKFSPFLPTGSCWCYSSGIECRSWIWRTPFCSREFEKINKQRESHKPEPNGWSDRKLIISSRQSTQHNGQTTREQQVCVSSVFRNLCLCPKVRRLRLEMDNQKQDQLAGIDVGCCFISIHGGRALSLSLQFKKWGWWTGARACQTWFRWISLFTVWVV